MNGDDSLVFFYVYFLMVVLVENIVIKCIMFMREMSFLLKLIIYGFFVCVLLIFVSFSFCKVEYRKMIQWKIFFDGFLNLFIEDVKYMVGKDVIFIGSFYIFDVIFE